MDLFSQNAKFTMDLCSFRQMLDASRPYSKEIFISLWKDIQKSIADGVIISHMEVLREIKQGGDDELSKWADKNEFAFKDYDINGETNVIKEIDVLFPGWVSGHGVTSLNADPWLVAQAKCLNLSIITEEQLNIGTLPKIVNLSIPDVCKSFGVRCVNIFTLAGEMGWKY